MESIYFTDQHEDFRQTVRKFVAKELTPYVEAWEEQGEIPRELFPKIGKLNFFGIRLPEKYGGSNCDFFYSIVFAEELARCGSGGLTSSLMVQDMVTPAISSLGTEEQKEEILVPALKGEKILALGITEPNAGSDVAAIESKAVRDGDYYLVNGTKIFISNGYIADCIVAAVKTDWSIKPHLGISLLIMKKDTPGFTARKLKKMGRWCSDTAELVFEDCKVPAENLLGKEGEGLLRIAEIFQGERLLVAARCISAAQKVYEDALSYARERVQFGKPIGKFQVIKHMLADMAVEIEAARQLVYYSTWLLTKGIKCIKEISMSKALASETANKIATNALQIYGGYGYMMEYSVQRAFRDLRCETLGGGTTQIHKEIIGKEIGL